MNVIYARLQYLLVFNILLFRHISFSNKILDCCKFVEDSNLFDICVKNYNSHNYEVFTGKSVTDSPSTVNKDPSKKFLLVTYATSDIYDYGIFSIAINSFVSESSNYTFLVLTPDTGHQFYSNDERWNKVNILIHLLQLIHREGGKYYFDYVCFLDLDLIMLNHEFNLNSIVNNNSWADVLISRDTEPENGIINSGF